MRMVVCGLVAGVLCVSRGIRECAWLPRVGGRGLGVCGELGIYLHGFNFYIIPKHRGASMRVGQKGSCPLIDG